MYLGDKSSLLSDKLNLRSNPPNRNSKSNNYNCTICSYDSEMSQIIHKKINISEFLDHRTRRNTGGGGGIKYC